MDERKKIVKQITADFSNSKYYYERVDFDDNLNKIMIDSINLARTSQLAIIATYQKIEVLEKYIKQQFDDILRKLDSKKTTKDNEIEDLISKFSNMNLQDEVLKELKVLGNKINKIDPKASPAQPVFGWTREPLPDMKFLWGKKS